MFEIVTGARWSRLSPSGRWQHLLRSVSNSHGDITYQTGGWTQFQSVLGALDSIARKHEISIANVAMRYVLDIPGVAAVIIGSSLTTDRQDKYIQTNLSTFEIVLDDADRAAIAAAQEGLTSIPGDCGDEYRYPPYLTASGDISHHFSQDQAEKDRLRSEEIERVIKEGGRVEVSSGSPYEPICVRPLPLILLLADVGGLLPSGALWRHL